MMTRNAAKLPDDRSIVWIEEDGRESFEVPVVLISRGQSEPSRNAGRVANRVLRLVRLALPVTER